MYSVIFYDFFLFKENLNFPKNDLLILYNLLMHEIEY
jgi:hypothetical protein